MKILVTGSSGLIGSEAVRFYDSQGWDVVGIDNNMRMQFFGPDGDTTWNLDFLKKNTKHFRHLPLDVRDREKMLDLFKREHFDYLIHCAAQPSHDLAARIPFIDFEVNVTGTLNLLEANRRYSPESVFIYPSTNKVYGDRPNTLNLKESALRYDFADPEYVNGIGEEFNIDASKHSLFGASKLAADIIAQEYGRYFNMPVGIFRGGCLTGEQHSGAQLHGFLSYLVHCIVSDKLYTIFGYKGKQVRDNIHSYDVIQAFECFRKNPGVGEVYNIGGGRENSCSVLEAIKLIEELSGKKCKYKIDDTPRIGDHICYYSNLNKLKRHYLDWAVTISLKEMLEGMVKFEQKKQNKKI